MKKLITITLLTAFLFAGAALKAQNQPQEYLGLPGDNLNLYAVMKLFQDSKTLEGFEKGLNEQNTRINNLDLNGDNYVDYIRVVDNIDGNIQPQRNPGRRCLYRAEVSGWRSSDPAYR
jgi:hypothetical protein